MVTWIIQAEYRLGKLQYLHEGIDNRGISLTLPLRQPPHNAVNADWIAAELVVGPIDRVLNICGQLVSSCGNPGTCFRCCGS